MRSARHIAIAEEYQRHDPLSTYVYSHGKDISMLAQVANDVVKLYLVYELVRCTSPFSIFAISHEILNVVIVFEGVILLVRDWCQLNLLHDPLSTYVYSHGKDISMLAQVANDVGS